MIYLPDHTLDKPSYSLRKTVTHLKFTFHLLLEKIFNRSSLMFFPNSLSLFYLPSFLPIFLLYLPALFLSSHFLVKLFRICFGINLKRTKTSSTLIMIILSTFSNAKRTHWLTKSPCPISCILFVPGSNTKIRSNLFCTKCPSNIWR